VQGLVRILLVSGGTISVALGIAGIVLPVLPATPFLLLAAFLYARSSKRFHDWLVGHRWFGPYIAAYRSGRGLTTRQLVSTLVPLWLSIGLTSWLAGPRWIVHVVLFACAIGVTLYLLSRRRR
jgi:uncharacterized membrane protein YbaN (DUF454 family)